jgi:rhamnosyltransferase
MKIAGVVVWYNPTEEDKKNIYSYLPSLDKLYIFDNSNKKNDFKKNKKIKYIFNGENAGIAHALNFGAKSAIEDGYKWLLTMDQDTIFECDKIEIMKNELKKASQDIAIICPWLETKLKVKKPEHAIDYPLDVMTSANFVNLDIYRKIGGFIDDFFIDGVDMEYCLRIKKNNYKIKRINTISIKHNLGNITYRRFLWKSILCLNHPYARYYYRMRNYHYIYDMYSKYEKEYCESILKFRATIFGIIFFERDKIKKIRALINGYNDYKKGIKGIYNS